MTDKKNIDDKINQVIADLDKLDTAAIQQADKSIAGYDSILSKIGTNPEVAIGTEIGHWKIIELLGQGGMSIVYLVERIDNQITQQAALKIIPNAIASQSMIDRFVRERQILSDLNHNNIAKLYDAGVTENDIPWFVMELVQGDDILSFAENNHLNTEQRIILFKQVCDALAYAHAHGVIHRDIKPSNLMVSEDKVIKLLDFGIASAEEQQSLTMTGAIIGTPGYMSPEQARGLNQLLDRRTDVFSLGVLLYKLLKQEMPFQAKSISEISYKIIHDEPTLMGTETPADLQAITFKCLEKKIENRYQSVKQLSKDLDAYLNGDVISARKITFFGRLGKKIKKHPIISSLITAAIVSSIMGIGYGINQTYETLRKVQIAEKHLSKAQEIKAKVRRTHMMPIHNVKNEYKKIFSEILQLEKDIKTNGSDSTGLSSFALGSAYLSMREYDKAFEFFKNAEFKGWSSPDLHASLGLILSKKWEQIIIHSHSILDLNIKLKYLAEQKEEIFNPAIKYLKVSQDGVSTSNYLSANLAFIENDLDKAIIAIEKEIEINPWNYDALAFASTIYAEKNKQMGEHLGYENSIKYKKLSDERIELAINIGRSDPINYSKLCQTMAVDVMYQATKFLEKIYQTYEKGINKCEDAIMLNIDSKNSYMGLSQIHLSMANYLYIKKKPYIHLFVKSFDTIQLALEKYPEDPDLLAGSVGSLVGIGRKSDVAEREIPDTFKRIRGLLDSDLPTKDYSTEAFFFQAKRNIEISLRVNPLLASSWMKLASIQRILAFLNEDTAQYDKANDYYDQSIASFTKVKELGNTVTGLHNIGGMYHNKSILRALQKRPLESIEYIKKAIEQNNIALEITKEKFALFINKLEFHFSLVKTLKETKISYHNELIVALKFVNQTCQLDYLESLHLVRIHEVIEFYKKLGVATNKDFPNCPAI